MRHRGPFASGTVFEHVLATPADGASGGAYHAILSDTTEPERRQVVDRNWSALLAALRPPVESTLRGGMSAGDIAYRLGALVHGFFRTRGVTLTSTELRRVVIALLETHRRGWPASAVDTTTPDKPTIAGPPSDGLVAFVDRQPRAPPAQTGSWNGETGMAAQPLVTLDLPSSLVSVDQRPIARVVADHAPGSSGPSGSVAESSTPSVSHQPVRRAASDRPPATDGGGDVAAAPSLAAASADMLARLAAPAPDRPPATDGGREVAAAPSLAAASADTPAPIAAPAPGQPRATNDGRDVAAGPSVTAVMGDLHAPRVTPARRPTDGDTGGQQPVTPPPPAYPGALEALLRDESVTTILIDGPRTVVVERAGRRERAEVGLGDAGHFSDVVWGLVARAGPAPGDAGGALIEGHLEDGSRLSVVSPPLAPSGPHVVIRRGPAMVIGLDGLVGEGMLSPRMAEALRAALGARLNLLVCGAEASDNAAVLAALVPAMAREDRIVSLARAAPLRPERPNHIRLVDAGADPAGARRAFAASLALRPDRLIVHDVAASVIPDLARAIAGGRDGVVASAPAPAALVLERWARATHQADAGLSLVAARRRMARAFQLVLQVERVRGVRRIARLMETAADVDPPRQDDLFAYDDRAGRFIATARRSRVLGDIAIG